MFVLELDKNAISSEFIFRHEENIKLLNNLQKELISKKNKYEVTNDLLNNIEKHTNTNTDILFVNSEPESNEVLQLKELLNSLVLNLSKLCKNLQTQKDEDLLNLAKNAQDGISKEISALEVLSIPQDLL